MKKPDDFLETLLKRPAVRFLFSLKEFLLLLVFYLTAVTTPLGQPQLKIEYELLKLRPPTLTSLNTETLSDDYQQLAGAKGLLKVEITNNSPKSIKELDIQIRANSISAASLLSNSSRLMKSTEKIVQHRQESPGKFSFPGFEEIPPKAYVQLLLWGDFLEGFWTKQVTSISDAESSSISASRKISGLRLFFADNLVFFALLFASYFLLVGLRRLTQRPD